MGDLSAFRGDRGVGLPEPTLAVTDGFVATVWRRPGEVTGEVTGEGAGEVAKLVLICQGEMSRQELREGLYLKGDDNFRRLYLLPALEAGLLEMTVPATGSRLALQHWCAFWVHNTKWIRPSSVVAVGWRGGTSLPLCQDRSEDRTAEKRGP